MFRILLCVIVLSSTIPVYAFGTYNNGFKSNLNMNKPRTTIATYQNPNRNYYNNPYRHHHHCPECHNYPYYSNSDLNALERYALKKNYRGESDIQRLERLESLAFGAIQYGDINSRYRNVENAILSRPQNSYRRSVIGNIANYFAGQATGFTPSIGDYASLGGVSTYPNPSYNNQRYEQYSNGPFRGGGWGIENSSFGNGTRVQILD